MRQIGIVWFLLLVSCPALCAQSKDGGGIQPPSQFSDERTAAAAFREVAAALEAAANRYVDLERAEPGDVRSAMETADRAFQAAQAALGVSEELRQNIPTFDRRGKSSVLPGTLKKGAAAFVEAARLLEAGEREKGETKAFQDGWNATDKAAAQDAWVTDPYQVLAIMLAILAVLFAMNNNAAFAKLFRIIPLLVFCYFVPTIFSNLGIIPIASPLYDVIKKQLLPASLVLLVLSVDIPAILKLGKNALVMFLAATASIVVGGPLALFVCQGLIPESMGDEAWKGLAALAGSWIGGGANFVAIGESAGASANTMSMMVVVDIAVAELWMVALLIFAGREKQMDDTVGADRSSIDEVREKIEAYEKEVAKPTTLPDLLVMLAIAFGATVIATALSKVLPDIGSIVKGFTWVVIIVTTIAVALSFTKARRLEGAGASKLGSVFLYLLVASIGAHAQFSNVLEVPGLVAVGVVWMLFHVTIMFIVRRITKSPIFFLAIGSKANVGGAASAPILASAFHPSLAPVGVLLAVGGYVLGTYAGLLCAWLLELVS